MSDSSSSGPRDQLDLGRTNKAADSSTTPSAMADQEDIAGTVNRLPEGPTTENENVARSSQGGPAGGLLQVVTSTR